ncbi:MAG: hydantoinase/oxoprolinase family protein, partial [Gammaproteobacteria bacterium]|nr:hydantoinase/oxoprolinase family protein [Gammaproteobacteria bacterium]
MAYRISIDTGGTFTDVVVSDADGTITLGKALTTHDRIFLGMREGMIMVAAQIGLSIDQLLDQTELLIYGTTRATNAIVEGKVAKTAFVTTEGFPDTLVYREGGKTGPHDFSRDYPDPFIPRRHTYEIRERIDAEGGVVVPFDAAQAVSVIETLRREKFDAVAICFLWSIKNPEHELAFAALLDKHLPSVPYTLSHQALPIIREYRRASATAIDASLKPLMQRHLHDMSRDLRDNGLRGRILVSTSMGGCLNVEELIERPIQTTKSGPAMAPVAGRAYARMEAEEGDVVICDTGGTTFDLGLVRAGEVVFTRETWIGERWRGHIVATSAVDVRSIGAGGGSIAWIDPGGLLRVGPQSAGSEPGPACYGR